MIIFEAHTSGVDEGRLLSSLVSISGEAASKRLTDGNWTEGLSFSIESVARDGMTSLKVCPCVSRASHHISLDEAKSWLEKVANAASAPREALERALSAVELVARCRASLSGTPVDETPLGIEGEVSRIASALTFFVLLSEMKEEALSTPLCVSEAPDSDAFLANSVIFAIAAERNIPLLGSNRPGVGTSPLGCAMLATGARFVRALPSIVPQRTSYGASFDPRYTTPIRAIKTRDESLEEVYMLEATLDDITGEEIALALERLQESTLEAHLLQGLGKKGRPLFVLRALAKYAELDAALRCILEDTTTIGVRYWPVSRMRMERNIEQKRLWEGGPFVRVKVSRLGDLVKEKVEFEDIKALKYPPKNTDSAQS
jgi:uncharacterized protein (DUF111 family)